MESLIFLAVWLGGASLHTLVELKSKSCCNAGWFMKEDGEKKCVRCKSESWVRDDQL